ncbi:MAG: GNAT family N-acetyltransferase [Planctomycetaceae bacterium]|nr:GNAT family N-acetyltransferase [Planctomycetaceae bacterium]
MFHRIINEHLQLHLPHPEQADELFALVDRNRHFLRQWLPWIDDTQTPDDTRRHLKERLQASIGGDEIHLTIVIDGAIVGRAGLQQIHPTNRTANIGYWLGEEFTGRGIMSETVRELIEIGRHYYSLQKLTIRCGTENVKSRAVPERLGFQHEGTLRRNENLYGRWIDHEVYSLLLEPNNSTESH